MSNEEAMKQAQKNLTEAIKDILLNINSEEDSYFDRTIYQNLYEYYLKRFSEKEYLEIGQFEEE